MKCLNGNLMPARRPFTLIEMVIVLAVLMVMLVLAKPVFERVALGSGVDNSVRLINSQLMLARTAAISTRQRVAVVFPGLNNSILTSTTQVPDAANYKSVIICTVDTNGVYQGALSGSKIEFLPVGTSIVRVQNSSGASSLSQGNNSTPPGFGSTTISAIKWADYGLTTNTKHLSTCYGVIFTPRGTESGNNDRYITVAEAEVISNSPFNMLVRNIQNQATLKVTGFSGKTGAP